MGAVKNIILGISIAIIFAFFVGFGIKTFYIEPEFEDFCGDRTLTKISSEQECIDANGKWESYELPRPEIRDDQLLCIKTASEENGALTLSCTTQEQKAAENGYCDVNYHCQKEFEEVEEDYARVLFIIAAFIGLITMIAGGFMLKHESVSPGLMGGGFLTIFYGIMRYWHFAGDWLRFVILGLILAMLIYFAYKKLSFK